MPANLPQLADYLRPPQPSFWSWQDDGRVLAWTDGVTLAFAAELQPVLTRLAPQGLPPLGSILLLLAACRDSWGKNPERVGLLAGLLAGLSGEPPEQLFRDVISGLDEVHRLPHALRFQSGVKAEVAASVFEGAISRRSSKESIALAQALADGLSGDVLEGVSPHGALTILLGDLANLRDGLNRFDAEAFALRLKTGLEQTVGPAPIEIDPATRTRRLLSQLEDDEELGGLARLARLLMAAVQLPRSLDDPEDLPLGGVSDITNRGTLDRLLLSELASDDLTLAVRVAMNEALYFRRESPPRTPPRHRSVLVDAGIRLWGVPRVFASAVALALTATADRKSQIATYRAAGAEARLIELTTREGLTDHLGSLESTAHPGEALNALAKRLSEEKQPAEVVLVTSEDVLTDRNFQRMLPELPLESFHIATVNRDGRFRLIQRSPRGGKLLREARFELDDILKRSSKQRLSLIDRKISELPAIFGIDPFPLRLSSPVSAGNSWYVQNRGVLTYTSTGRLLFWDHTGMGGRQLAVGLPSGKLHWAGTAAHDGVVSAVVGRMRRDGLHGLQIDLSDGSVTSAALRLDFTPEEVVGKSSLAFVIGHLDHRPWVNVVSLHTGELLASEGLPPTGPRRGRYFEHQGPKGALQWSALSFDGVKVQIEPVVSRQKNQERPITYVDVQGAEGGMGITAEGKLFVNNGVVVPINHGLNVPVRIRGISRDGTRVLLSERYGKPTARQRLVLLNMLTRKCRDVASEHAGVLEPQLAQFARSRVLRNKFSGITVDDQGRLALVGRRDQLWPLLLDEAKRHVTFPRSPSKPASASVMHFVPVTLPSEARVELQMANWPDDSIAWLDPRGLLHLRSSWSDLPQCTIVLGERETAGWMADGRTWGSRYYLGGDSSVSAEEAYEMLLRFVERLP